MCVIVIVAIVCCVFANALAHVGRGIGMVIGSVAARKNTAAALALFALLPATAHSQSLASLVQPRAVSAKKVWTNDDLPAVRPRQQERPDAAMQVLVELARAVAARGMATEATWHVIPAPRPGDWGNPVVTVPPRQPDTWTVTTVLPWGPRTRTYGNKVRQ